MKKNILIIGKKSFIGSNLLLNLKHKHNIKITSFNRFIKKDLSKVPTVDFLINCTSNKNYIKN